jgi:anti-sigma factor RsiW
VSAETPPPSSNDAHAAAEAKFSDFVDGELSAAERTELEQHLAGCERCRAELESFKKTLSAVHGAHAAAPSAEFMDSLRSQIRERSRGRFFSGKRRNYRLEIASLVTLLIAVTIYVVLSMLQPIWLLK